MTGVALCLCRCASAHIDDHACAMALAPRGDRIILCRWDTFERRVLDPSRLTQLPLLQPALLRTGFRLLRRGGALIYSTCSFARAQNEDEGSLPIVGSVGAPGESSGQGAGTGGRGWRSGGAEETNGARGLR